MPIRRSYPPPVPPKPPRLPLTGGQATGKPGRQRPRSTTGAGQPDNSEISVGRPHSARPAPFSPTKLPSSGSPQKSSYGHISGLPTWPASPAGGPARPSLSANKQVDKPALQAQGHPGGPLPVKTLPPPPTPLAVRQQERLSPVGNTSTGPVPSSAPSEIPASGAARPAARRPTYPSTTSLPELADGQASRQAEEIVIRTMVDDINDIKQGRSSPSPQSSEARAPAPPRPLSQDPRAQAKQGFSPVPPVPASPAGRPASPPAKPTDQPASSPRVFPLPPQGSDIQKVVMAPIGKRRRRGLTRVLFLIIFLLLLTGGGAAAWFFYFQENNPFAPEPGQPAVAVQVLPSDSLIIVQYRLESAQDRSDINAAWTNQVQSAPSQASFTTLLAGDPRLLLSDSDIEEFYYVTLADSTRPFLVVPQTAALTENLQENSDAHYVEYEGWYIVHPLTVDPYLLALAAGTVASQGGESLLQDTGIGAPLRLILGESVLPTLRQDIAGPPAGEAGEHFLAGKLQKLALAGKFSNNLELSGTATARSVIPATSTNQQLLSLIPAQVTVARLGANFFEDVEEWLTMTNTVEADILQRPLVQQLFAQLTGPYAYFTYGSPSSSPPLSSPSPQSGRQPATIGGGNQALGFIIELPLILQGKVTLGEPALEEALPALIPLLIDQRTIPPLTFTERIYEGTPLRYVNLVGVTTTLDYAVTDTHLLITTSKDSMLTLLDTIGQRAASLTRGGNWQTLLTNWGSLPASHDIVLGTLQLPALRQFLPPRMGETGLPFGLAIQGDPTSPKAQAIIELSPASTPITSPQASPPGF